MPESQRIYLNGITFPRPFPISAPRSEVIHSASVPPRKTNIGYPNLEVMAIKDSWVLSPNSRSATATREVTNGLPEGSSSSFSAFSGRKERSPKRIKIPADTYLTTDSGTYLATTAPTVTASPFRMTNARAAPRKTGRNPYLADSVNIAICVLSPISAIKVRPKAEPKAFSMVIA